MAEVQTKEEAATHKGEGTHKGEVAKREPRDVVVSPQSVPQSTFPSTIREGIPGMVNRMVDYNAVSRSCDTPAGIPPARAVSQSTTWDGGCVLGGTLNGFLGISILDPTLVQPTSYVGSFDTYQQYNELGILTKGEIFAGCAVACVAGDPLSFIAADGTLTNTGGVVVPGARWKYTRANPGDLNVVQLGIQR